MTAMITSESHPIRVGILPREPHGLPGEIGLTFAPGRKGPTKRWDRDLGVDLRRLREPYRTNDVAPHAKGHTGSLAAGSCR
jgi:hypothetical protein